MFARVCLLFVTSLVPAMGWAQRNVQAFPKEILQAKTVAIVNNTHNEQVEQGAADALKRWGKLTIVDDTDVADITLTFSKKNEHEGSSTQKTGEDGKPSSSYGVSFSSSILMKASVKGATTSFYTTTTGESKKKAGAACVTDLQGAFNNRP